MFRKMVLVVLFMSSLFADFSEIDAVKLRKMIKNGVVVIDIRRDEEFKHFGIIEGSHMLTFFDGKGKYNIPLWMNEFVKLVKDKKQPFVIYCAHANRTKVVGNFLSKQLNYENVYDLKGGINYGWIDKGFKTVRIK